MGFWSERISEHTTRIVDPLGVAMYLVEGSARAALLDTGCGCPGLRAEVDRLTRLPVTVLLTHGHVDHALGAAEFGEAYLNPKDLPLFCEHADMDYRKRFAALAGKPEVSGTLIEALPCDKMLPLHDGDRFDLGGVSIAAFSVPGHTMGSMVFYIDVDRAMLLGDACGPGTILIEDYSASIDTYLTALESFADRAPHFELVLRNHGSFESGAELLGNVIEVCRAILDGREDHVALGPAHPAMLPHASPLPLVQAMRTEQDADGTMRRIDGKEGNVTYRVDKLPAS